MSTVILVIHLMIAVAMVAVILLQRSEGGALGIGGGGGFMTGRGTANLLTRLTAFLAAAFFATSIILTILSRGPTQPASIVDQTPATVPSKPGESEPPSAPDGLPALKPLAPAVPQSE